MGRNVDGITILSSESFRKKLIYYIFYNCVTKFTAFEEYSVTIQMGRFMFQVLVIGKSRDSPVH